MGMTGSQPTYPNFATHDEVACRSCGRNLGKVHEQSFSFPTAPWMKVCKPCYAVTWYSIVPKVDFTYCLTP